MCHGCACSEQQQAHANDDFGVEESAVEGEYLGSFFQSVSVLQPSVCVSMRVYNSKDSIASTKDDEKKVFHQLYYG